MKIEVTTTCAGIDFAYGAGEIVDVPEDRAVDLLDAGHAKPVVERPVKRTTKRVTKPGEER